MTPRNDLPIIHQNGKFRAQLSNLRITDAELPLILQRAKQQAMHLYAKQISAPVDTVRFHDVPLIEVTLNRNQLTNAAMPVINEFLLSNPLIESFEILGNHLTDPAAHHVKDLIVQSSLQRIKVGDNQFMADGAKTMALGLLHANKQFVQLHVGGNPIGDEGVAVLCRACAHSRVEVLGLRDTGIVHGGWLAVANMAMESSHVVELQLKGNRISPEAAEELQRVSHEAASLRQSGGVCSALLTLSLSACQLTATSLPPIIDFVALHPRLTHLDLSNNDIGDEGAACLLRWLEGGSAGAMRTLNLQRTALTHTGLELLTNVRAGFSGPLSRLRDLDLSYNQFGVEGTPLITNLVESCPNLERLVLHRCNLGGNALRPFCTVLSGHRNLRDLDFSSNFSDQQADAWEEVLTQNKRIERLLLTDNNMTAAHTTKLVHCITSNPRSALKAVQIGGQSRAPPLANAVLPNVHVALVQCLARNRGEARTPPAPPVQPKVPLRTEFPNQALPTYEATLSSVPADLATQQPGMFKLQPQIPTTAAPLQHYATPAPGFLQAHSQPPILQYTAYNPQLVIPTLPSGCFQSQQLPFFPPQGQPMLVSADSLGPFAPADFSTGCPPTGPTIYWCPVLSSSCGGPVMSTAPCVW